MNKVSVDNLRTGSKFRFVGHAAKFEVVKAADVADGEVEVKQIDTNTPYTVEGFRMVEVYHDF